MVLERKKDCLTMLTADILTSFEMKKQTVAAFLDISGAYDNLLIDVLCRVMLEKELPLGIVLFMWSLRWCKTLVLSAECMTLTGSATGFSFEPIFVQLTRIWY
jgi:hypothetical protein